MTISEIDALLAGLSADANKFSRIVFGEPDWQEKRAALRSCFSDIYFVEQFKKDFIIVQGMMGPSGDGEAGR